MQVFGKEISEYSNEELTDIARSLDDAFNKRQEASRHPKFQKMAFPEPNQAFEQLRKNIKEEIHKRNLDSWI